MNEASTDAHLLEVFLAPIRKCAQYKPAFGQATSEGLEIAEFRTLYGADAFYAWLGPDEPILYAAHKAAGGLTSVYRQIGVGSERLVRAIFKQCLGLSDQQLRWGYEYEKASNTKGTHSLDARIRTSDLTAEARKRFSLWLAKCEGVVASKSFPLANVAGVVFEVRQGYKSADSKRQNADLRFGVHAYQGGLLPAFAILSAQVSEPVIRRYRSDGMLVLTGVLREDPTESTFAFFRQIVGYDLANFFVRNSPLLKAEINLVVKKLLSP
jgi:hypothetical protein